MAAEPAAPGEPAAQTALTPQPQAKPFAPKGPANGTREAAHDELRMSFLAHLGELRKRLAWALGALFLCSSLAFFYAPELFAVMQWPLHEIQHVKMVVLSPLEMFTTYIKLAVMVGLLTSSPWMLLQLWWFVAPGLYPSERKLAVPFVLLGSSCFVGGAAFCFFLVLPASFAYLVEMVPASVETHYSVAVYFALVVQLTLAFGAIFELPLVMMLLGAAGLVSVEKYVAFRKYWFIVATIIGGVVTPTPDPMTQMMMAVPLVVFYEMGIIGTRFLAGRVRSPGRAPAAGR
jgi:sec-independent protein translocase protein TatC